MHIVETHNFGKTLWRRRLIEALVVLVSCGPMGLFISHDAAGVTFGLTLSGFAVLILVYAIDAAFLFYLAYRWGGLSKRAWVLSLIPNIAASTLSILVLICDWLLSTYPRL